MTDDDLQKLALLARLRLSDDEVQQLGPQINQILDFVDKLSSLDTSGVEPMSTALDVANRIRPDDLRESLSVEAALSNSPRHDDTYFLVPPVLGPN
jgi:aspartyl-tRNA(Asn)/glutamyl-tRNA(Gln) amidotransferase subunit C